MSTKNILGIGMLALPFVGLFVGYGMIFGVLPGLALFGGCAFMLSWMSAAFYLLACE